MSSSCVPGGGGGVRTNKSEFELGPGGGLVVQVSLVSGPFDQGRLAFDTEGRRGGWKPTPASFGDKLYLAMQRPVSGASGEGCDLDLRPTQTPENGVANRVRPGC